MTKRYYLMAAILLITLTLLFKARPLTAQEAGAVESIQQLRIQVMPEFDDPRVLVIIQGRLNAGAEEFPRPVTFRIPLGAQINQMASMNVTDGSTNPLTYETAPDPADPRWTQVTYTLDKAHFFYEFYYDPLDTGRERDFTYLYSTLHPVSDLLVEIQEPLRATDFTTDPTATLTRIDAMLGFTYHQFRPGTLAAGETWSANVTYTKQDQDPSLSREAVQAMQAGGALQNEIPSSVTTANLAAAPSATTAALPAGNTAWVFAGVAMAAIAAGAFVLRSRRKALVELPGRPEETQPPANFCPQCGTPAKAAARFCHACGNHLYA